MSVTARVHDDEPDTSRRVVRALLRSQVPALAGLPLRLLSNTGTDNALYRLGQALVVRLPRTTGAAQALAAEMQWLPRLRTHLSVAVPDVVHLGDPSDAYPHTWAILTWLPGRDAWVTRDHHGWFGQELAADLGRTVVELHALPAGDAPHRGPGMRGGPLSALDDRVRWWLSRADGLLDVAAVTRVWEQCLQQGSDYSGEPILLHGDLIPGNLLIERGRLSAVIDWGGIGAGDPAQDLSPGWSVLDPRGVATFRDILGIAAPTWMRGRGFMLEQAIGGVIYYTSRGHPLAEVMRRSLDRVLAGP